MSKLKISFSALLTLILLSMFAAFASAEDPALGNGGQPYDHKQHGNFQNNTNSCANCHSTHNGDSATLLRFESAEYDLCLSCHDGTLGFYNVKVASGAGTFGELEENSHNSVSMHNVQGETRIDSAPGSLTENDSELACSSCHNPHGNTNDRLLKTEINGITIPAAVTLDLSVDKVVGNLTIYKSKGTKFSSTDQGATTPQKVYSAFCSTCHEDYLTSRSDVREDGHYSHSTNSYKSGRNCGSCHYAHGTDITLLKDTQGKTVGDYVSEGWSQEQAENYMRDSSEGGSALKKYTGMAVCWACHQSTHGEGLQGGTVVDPQYLNGSGQFPGKPQR